MPRRDIITAALAVAAYFSYYYFVDIRDRRWMYYVCTGVLLAWLGWCMRCDGLAQRRILLAFTGTLLLIEGPQQAVCGLLRWQAPGPQDLCVQVLGDGIYTALASLLLAAAWTLSERLWPSRPQAK